MKTGTIYGLKTANNDQILYVGQTTFPLSDRLNRHFKYARRGSNAPLPAWLRDADPATVELIELETDVSEDRLIEREEHWIGKLKTLVSDGGLNVRSGYGWAGGRPDAVEYARRMNEKLRTDPELAAETRRKGAETLKKRYENEPELGTRISERNRRRYEDPEEREKTGALAREVWQRPEYREKLSAAQRARFDSEEGRKKLSEMGRAGGAKGGVISGHRRWHVSRGIVKETCQLCQDGVL